MRFFRRRKQKVSRLAPPSTVLTYYWNLVAEVTAEPGIPHPNRELYLRTQIHHLIRKSLGTRTVEVLERLYELTEDSLDRVRLAKKALALRRGYLEWHKEFSDRALIRLSEREKLFDKWEGIYILGCFGGERAKAYLEKQLTVETDALLAQVMSRSIAKIEGHIKQKVQERGL